VQEAALRPSVGRWRVIIVEDADRLTERAADALLKALEEPTPRTVWMLCAPSLEDVIITIRSRSRHVRLRTPPVEAVAELLERRDGVDGPMAMYAARAAQSHVGLARRLARDEGARIRRRDVISMATKIVGVGDAIGAAADLAQIADEESSASASERDAAEKSRLMETLGADPTARTHPPHIRSQLAALEKEQKTRATRYTRDMIDRSLVDLTSIYRDAMVLRLGSDVALVNPDAIDKVRALAGVFTAEQLLLAMDAINEARERINANVPPLLALEAMALQLRVPRDLGI
jgi:DNA polymerase-3 subunit delta'